MHLECIPSSAAAGNGKALRDDFNVILIHQYLRSSATNMLDLGVWVALRNVVENLHFRKHMEAKALFNTVEEA